MSQLSVDTSVALVRGSGQVGHGHAATLDSAPEGAIPERLDGVRDDEAEREARQRPQGENVQTENCTKEYVSRRWDSSVVRH